MALVRRFRLTQIALLTLALVQGCGGDRKVSSAAAGVTSALPEGQQDTARPQRSSDNTTTRESVELRKHVPTVGDKELSLSHEKTRGIFVFKERAGRRATDLDELETKEVLQECLAITDQSCSTFEVTFLKHKKTSTEHGQLTTKEAPTHGKSYIVSLQEGSTTITSRDGRAVPAEEAAIVDERYRNDFGKDKRVNQALPDVVRVGDTLDDLARVFLEEIQRDNPTANGTIKMTVISLGEAGGRKSFTVDIAMNIHERKKGLPRKLSAKGTIAILADGGAPLTATLRGPVEVVTESVELRVVSERTESYVYEWK